MGGLIGGIAYVLPALVRPHCPVCVRRSAKLVARRRGYDRDDGRATYFEARYACTSCSAELVQRDGGPLITKAAWEAGMRDAPPTATVVSR